MSGSLLFGDASRTGLAVTRPLVVDGHAMAVLDRWHGILTATIDARADSAEEMGVAPGYPLGGTRTARGLT